MGESGNDTQLCRGRRSGLVGPSGIVIDRSGRFIRWFHHHADNPELIAYSFSTQSCSDQVLTMRLTFFGTLAKYPPHGSPTPCFSTSGEWYRSLCHRTDGDQ